MRRFDARALSADAVAATAVLFLAVPQGLAYATIAGLPPAVGLYAAAIPAIVGSLVRSSRHVVSGPTNALSLLVGAAVADAVGADPVQVALTLALMVGVIQAVAGVLRLGAVVDFISSAVVVGYITGAAVLIGVGQLHSATGTSAVQGRIWVTLGGWLDTLTEADGLAVGVAVGTVALVVAIRAVNRRLRRRIPSAIVAISAAIAVNVALSLEDRGLKSVSDLGEIPRGLPPLTVPDLGLAQQLLGVAVACAVLSLVESSAVGRAIAARTGQRIDSSREFLGQGLSNVSAAVFGGYPVSGSLARSVLIERLGGTTRVAGVLSGVLMIIALLVAGPVLDRTPVAALAGLLFVIAYDLIDVRRIRSVVGASRSDLIAFAATVLGTWVLSLDLAIYLGVGISLVLFLRRARLLRVTELVVGTGGKVEERPVAKDCADGACPKVRMLHVEGSLFFGAAGELQTALTRAVESPEVQVLLVRLRRTRGLDATTATVFAAVAERLAAQGRHLVLAGMTPTMMDVLTGSGAAETIGAANLFPSRQTWFLAFEQATQRAAALCSDTCDRCPLPGFRPATSIGSNQR